ncbi:hypothetical protein METSCH_D02970 [Metschnikowia aff. pulcherrima]|uniref:SWIM-type domain-containing protein n=1 Tax=Metschnikowia aff. pulcherrima TaxID=2163413 RepID=A0A4V1AEH5_9ASCO|nr:hypothetical protein METSCH_D02970 [Metschnikowia aff. pulcherrima]
MTVVDLSACMKKYDIDYFYRREEILKKHTVPENPNRKRLRLSLAGLDVYLCLHAKQAKLRTTPVLRRSSTQRCGCKARFTIQFSHGYEHTPENKLDVDKHGDKKVKVTWFWKHEGHDINDPEQYCGESLSTNARNLLRFAVLYHGVTWNQIQRLQTELLTSDHVELCELLKITKRNVDYIIKESLSQSTKCIPIAAGFGCLAHDIQSSGGFAEYTTMFKSLDGSHPSKELKNAGGKKVWSFCFMSVWQKEMFSRNSRIIHLDSTHKTCYGLEKSENAYLSTILVKNQTAGSGAPVAFMVSNSGQAPVIADFLRKIQSFTGITPAQAVIDCDEAETGALKAAYGPEFPIMYCRFHVLNALAIQIPKKIKLRAFEKDLELKVLSDFKEVLSSRTESEGHQRIADFLKKYEAHTEFVAYVDKQWFTRKKKALIIQGFNPKYVRGENTNNIIESYHNQLKLYKFIGRSSDRRPDVLARDLFKDVIPSYKAKEKKVSLKLLKRVYDQAETFAKEKASEFSTEEAEAKVSFSGETEITVQSFTNIGTQYLVHLVLSGGEKDICTCPAYGNSGSLCKHIFLAERVWKAQSSPQVNFGDVRNSEESSILDTSYLQMIQAVRSFRETNFSSFSDCIQSADEGLENLPNAASIGVEGENDISFDVEAQSTMYMENKTTAEDEEELIEANGRLMNLLENSNSHTQDEETSWEDRIVSQGPSLQPQQTTHNFAVSHAAAQTQESGIQLSSEMSKEILAKLLGSITRQHERLNPVEKELRFLETVSKLSRQAYLDLKSPHSKQRH